MAKKLLMASILLRGKEFFLVIYILIFSAHAVVIRGSGASGSYAYNPALLCIFAELTKLVMSAIFFLFEQDFKIDFQLILQAFVKRDRLMVVPAFLYSLYNNLSFLNLLSYEANIYQVLMNSRILITGFLSVLLLHRSLNGMQWASLVLLAVGCTVANYSSKTADTGFWSMAFVVLQASLSSGAGVYNELLLKKREPGALDSIHLQNATQYVFCIIFNGIFLVLTGQKSQNPDDEKSSSSSFSFVFFLIVFLMASGGITAAMILKHFSAITKAFATSVEMLFTAIAAHFVLGTELTLLYFISFLMVSAAIIMHNRSSTPAVQTISSVSPDHDEIEEELKEILINGSPH